MAAVWLPAVTKDSGGASAASRIWDRLRLRHLWLDHAFRAAESYGAHYGDYYAAAITYFSVLSLAPTLMVAFAVAAIVLAGDHALLARLQAEIGTQVPGALGDHLNLLVRNAVDARGTVGAIGLVIALYSGIAWMTHLRDALTEQWGLERPRLPRVPTALRDLLALIGLGVALTVSFTITAAGGAAGALLLRLAGLASDGWARPLLTLVTVPLALMVNWLMFSWVIARLPRHRVGLRMAARGALLAAVGFEVLKQAAGVLLARIAHSPTGAVLGPAIGLLVFANLVARFLLFATAWTATSHPRTPANADADPDAPGAVSPEYEAGSR